MNVKTMTSEHLEYEIKMLSSYAKGLTGLSKAELAFLKACRKELMRRWGIKG